MENYKTQMEAKYREEIAQRCVLVIQRCDALFANALAFSQRFRHYTLGEGSCRQE